MGNISLDGTAKQQDMSREREPFQLWWASASGVLALFNDQVSAGEQSPDVKHLLISMG